MQKIHTDCWTLSRKDVFQETHSKESEKSYTSHPVFLIHEKMGWGQTFGMLELSSLTLKAGWGPEPAKKLFMTEKGWRRKGLPQCLASTTLPICQESQDLRVFCFLCYGFHAAQRWAASSSVSFNLPTSYLLGDVMYLLCGDGFGWQLLLQSQAWLYLQHIDKITQQNPNQTWTGQSKPRQQK